jgi:lipopolysaccharide export system protein LptA
MHMRAAVIGTAFLAPTFLHAQSMPGEGQGRVEILNADEWLYDKTASGAQRLKGNVRFKHADAVMACDSAHLFEEQRVDAFSRVRINQSDTLTAEADVLRYNGRDRLARLEGNVRLRDRSMELTTPSLAYDMKGKSATYSSGGRITSTSDGNVLTSGTGTYFADQRRFVFGRNVLLEHPDHRTQSDTMHYAAATGVCSFFGPTTITQGATIINTRGGSYDTRAERARFNRRTSVQSKGRLLEGDSLFYDKRTGVGLSWGNVSIADSSGDMRVLGSFGRYSELDERTMVTGRAELQLRMGADTLFLHGDTLFAEPEGSARRITARRSVRFFKRDMQGACDTLVYSEADSLITLRYKPVLWSNTDQITGDTIRIRMKDGQAHRLYVAKSAFLLSEADSLRRDQVAGRSMTGFFADGELHRLDVEGNAQTVYHAKEQRDGIEEVFGVNRADCSRIRVRMKEGRIDAVVFLDRPDAVLYPLKDAPADELVLPGMLDRGAERPLDRAGIFDE